MPSPEDIRILNDFINDPEFKKLVEDDFGWPTIITIDWQINLVQFDGPNRTDQMPLGKFLQLVKLVEGKLQ